MGRVAWLILLVVVSVCVVFYVLCCLQNNPVFLSVTISHIYIYLLTLNNKQKMKIMGRVARLILLVVVSVCVVFYVLCFLQNNLVLLSVTTSHVLKNENYKICFLAGFFVDQIKTKKNTTRKKRYSRLAVGWNKSQITIEHQLSLEKLQPEKKNYSRLAIGWNKSLCRVKIPTPTTTGKKFDRKKKGTVICNTRNILILLCLYFK